MNEVEKIPVYFVPGLAASVKIFDYIKLPDRYTSILLDWIPPVDLNETIEQYAKRMAERVKQPKAILIGVSFGGVMVQEMKAFLDPEKIIIISSVKCQEEMPFYIDFSKKTKAHKILPNLTIDTVKQYEKFAFTDWSKHKIQLYKKYFNVNDKNYLPWAIDSIVNWSRKNPDPDVIHIHGTKDSVFPIKNIKSCIEIEGGNHAMILSKAKKINAILESVLNDS